MAPFHRYTHGHHESVLRSHRWRTAENSAGYLLPHLTGSERLLDVGAGPGTITADLAERVAHVTALEPTPEALQLSRDHLTERGITADFVVGDVHALDLPDDSFDVVHAHQVLQHLTDPVAALREMLRVCRPGGLVAVRDADYRGFTWYPALPELDTWQEVYQQVARGNGGEPDAGRRLLGWAHAAEAAEVRPGASVWCFATPEDRHWWGDSWAVRVTESDFAEQAVAGGYATPETLQAVAAAWLRWAEHPDGWLTIPHGELLLTA